MSKPPEARIICAWAGIFGATRYGESYKHDPIVDSCCAGTAQKLQAFLLIYCWWSWYVWRNSYFLAYQVIILVYLRTRNTRGLTLDKPEWKPRTSIINWERHSCSLALDHSCELDMTREWKITLDHRIHSVLLIPKTDKTVVPWFLEPALRTARWFSISGGFLLVFSGVSVLRCTAWCGCWSAGGIWGSCATSGRTPCKSAVHFITAASGRETTAKEEGNRPGWRFWAAHHVTTTECHVLPIRQANRTNLFMSPDKSTQWRCIRHTGHQLGSCSSV